MLFDIDRYGIHIGPLYVRFYGIIIMTGALLATLLAQRLLKRKDKDPEIVWDALIWALVFGIIGARLYHVFTPSISAGGWEQTLNYLRNPITILTTWEGGLGMPGAILGGVLGLYIYARRNNIAIGLILDVAAPGVALAQAIGRWGNFVNQELFGFPTDLPWGIRIDKNILELVYRDITYKGQTLVNFDRFHPLFLYESLWNLLNMAILLYIWRRHEERMGSGELFLIYLIIYPLGRFLLEFIRLDYVPLFGINLNQVIMLLVAVASGFVLFLRVRKPEVQTD
jgi:phosphatidylglycerol:prolipoprotein diacylglycerol transferase